MDNAVNYEVDISEDAAELSRKAAERIVSLIAAGDPGSPFSIALSGGKTPHDTYALLGSTYRTEVEWSRVHLFWGDERFVPHDSSQSNYFMVRETLLEALPIPPENVHPIPTTALTDAENAAKAYQKMLEGFFSKSLPTFDLSILGMGDDGHTASLFPGSAALSERSRPVVVTQAPVEPSIRVSLSFPALESATTTIVLVSGEKKREIVGEVLDDPETARTKYPIAMLRPSGRMIWMLDRDAAGSR